MDMAAAKKTTTRSTKAKTATRSTKAKTATKAKKPAGRTTKARGK